MQLLTVRLFIIQILLVIVIAIVYHLFVVNLLYDIHNSYFIYRFNFTSIIFFIYTSVCSLVYYLIRKTMSPKTGLLHFALGLPLFILTYLEQLGFYNHDPQPRRYYTDGTSIFTETLPFLDIFPVYMSVIYFFAMALFILGLTFFIMSLFIRKIKIKMQ